MISIEIPNPLGKEDVRLVQKYQELRVSVESCPWPENARIINESMTVRDQQRAMILDASLQVA